MPLYDFQCSHADCSYKLLDVFQKLMDHSDKIEAICPIHGLNEFKQSLSVPPAAHDWGNAGQGRYFEHVSKTGEYFRDKKAFKNYLRAHGLREYAG